MGVLGLVFFENTTRRREVGIRKIFGSSEVQILSLINRFYWKILLVSFFISCPIAYHGISKWMANFSQHVPLYWWVFLMSGLIIMLITTIVVSWQSWKMAYSKPLESLRG